VGAAGAGWSSRNGVRVGAGPPARMRVLLSALKETAAARLPGLEQA